MSDSKAEIEFEDKETLLRSALTFKEMGWEEESRAITRAVANLAEKNNEIAAKDAELARLREALEKIANNNAYFMRGARTVCDLAREALKSNDS